MALAQWYFWHPVIKREGPLKVQSPNRLVVLMLYGIVVFFTGSTHWGWDGFQSMLYKQGAYHWLCFDSHEIIDCEGCALELVKSENKAEVLESSSSQVLNLDKSNTISDIVHQHKVSKVEEKSKNKQQFVKGHIDCSHRRQVIANLFTTAIGCQFTFSIFAGLIVDRFGPKICSMFGFTLMALGWICLSFASQKYPVYFLSMSLIGLSTDSIYFPLISVSNLFPKRRSLILTILGSLRSCSFAIPVIMKAIFTTNYFGENDLWKIILGYLFLCLLPCCLISLKYVPYSAFKISLSLKEVGTVLNSVEVEKTPVNGSWNVDENKDDSLQDLKESARDLKSGIFDLHEDKLPISQSFFDDIYEDEKKIQNDFDLIINKMKEEKKEKIINLIKKYILTKRFILIILIFSSNLIRNEFFTKSHNELLKSENGLVLKYFSVFNVASFLPAPLFGFLGDKFGAITSIQILNLAGILQYLFVCFESTTSKFISVLCMSLYNSFVLSGLYCYINTAFPSKHFGKLSGIASLFGGWFLVLSIPLYKVSQYLGSFTIPVYIMLGLGVINAILLEALARAKLSI